MKHLKKLILLSATVLPLSVQAQTSNEDASRQEALTAILGVGYTQAILGSCEATQPYAVQFENFLIKLGMGEKAQEIQDLFYQKASETMRIRIAFNPPEHAKKCEEIARNVKEVEAKLGKDNPAKGKWLNPLENEQVKQIFGHAQNTLDPQMWLVKETLKRLGY